MRKFQVLVIGGGHAGLEAACMAAQFPNIQVAILSMPDVPLASAPCNPAIGGVGKGQVVREIDALGGVMGRLADQSGIQYRTLNSSKGFAVQSTRVQIDKEAYSRNAEIWVSQQENIVVIREQVDLIEEVPFGFSVRTTKGNRIEGQTLIVTTGTFLNGKLHSGREQVPGGRRGHNPSVGLGGLFSKVATLPVRFKTGTPPRIKLDTVDTGFMEEQESDDGTRNFHCLHTPYTRFMRQVSCFLTKTTPLTMQIIRQHKDESPIFNGQIQGIGPRYCPSIEDKAYRYPDRDIHHIFIEPEGLDLQTLYPNGVSTSLPLEVQEKFLRTIPGLEHAEVAIPGYAVEYDVVDTSCLNATLEYHSLPGLYFAGQVNGTSGYEEAAGQGLIAGLNAACKVLGRPPIVLSRFDSYIGVMIEDLISNRRDEPYRLFTARAENRLLIREDNVTKRMAPYRKKMQLWTALDQFQVRFLQEYEWLWELCDKSTYVNNAETRAHFALMGLGPVNFQSLSLAELLKWPDLNPIEVLNKECRHLGADFMPDVIACVAISRKYEGYVVRAEQQNQKIQRLDSMKINWQELSFSTNISYECKQRIERIRPETFGQLRQIEGIRPATLAIVAGKLW